MNTILIITNASVKNNVASSILHIHREQNIAKNIHHTMNITSTLVELFAIRCGINQTIQLQDIDYIIIVIDPILAAWHIFDMSIHLYQLNSITISNDLRVFFNKNSNNMISFWDCLSSNKWPSHLLSNKESKYLKAIPVFSSKYS